MNRTAFSLEVFGDQIPASDIFETGSNSHRLAAMRKALSKAIETELTECQRIVTTEFYFNGESVTSIAKKHGVSKSTVSRHLSRSRERLKGALKYGLYPLWNEKL